MIIEQPARFLRWLYPHALWRMDPSEKAVYLTFDDGPIPEATPFVLDLLDELGIKATFFMVGDNVRKYPELYLEVLRRGHHVGNHTFNHIGGIKWLSWKYLANVYRCDRLFKTLTPRRNINLFRPPHGYMGLVQYRTLRYSGYTVVMWDLVTRDYSRLLSADDVLANVKRYARPGSIITFHDSLKSIDKLRLMLRSALEWLRNEGYEFKLL